MGALEGDADRQPFEMRDRDRSGTGASRLRARHSQRACVVHDAAGDLARLQMGGDHPGTDGKPGSHLDGVVGIDRAARDDEVRLQDPSVRDAVAERRAQIYGDPTCGGSGQRHHDPPGERRAQTGPGRQPAMPGDGVIEGLDGPGVAEPRGEHQGGARHGDLDGREPFAPVEPRRVGQRRVRLEAGLRRGAREVARALVGRRVGGDHRGQGGPTDEERAGERQRTETAPPALRVPRSQPGPDRGPKSALADS